MGCIAEAPPLMKFVPLSQRWS